MGCGEGKLLVAVVWGRVEQGPGVQVEKRGQKEGAVRDGITGHGERGGSPLAPRHHPEESGCGTRLKAKTRRSFAKNDKEARK